MYMREFDIIQLYKFFSRINNRFIYYEEIIDIEPFKRER